jgi:phage I-like protein
LTGATEHGTLFDEALGRKPATCCGLTRLPVMAILAAMSGVSQTIALNAQGLPDMSEGVDVPEWVHLLPVGAGSIETADRRGPYHVKDAEQIIAASLQGEMDLPIDENHATDLAAPNGLPAPARGWITALEARDDGIWGKVKWSAEGRDLIKTRAYRALSPVILHDKAKNVLAILRASLINKPNMRGLTALNQETDDMSFLAKLAAQLGLNAEASEADITGAVTALQGDGGGNATALQSQMNEIGVALGVADGGDGAAILAAAQARPAASDGDVVVSLQAEVATLTTSLNTERETRTRKDAETYVDGEIAKGRAGLKPMRDRYVTMHMKDAVETEALIGALPVLSGTSGLTDLPPDAKDGEVSLNAEQANIATMLGVSPDDFIKTLKEEAL